MSSGTIFDIKRYAINDGPGIRTAVFLKGCPLKCWWCHNPEGQFSQPQLMFRENRCKLGRACEEVCPQGAIRWEDGSITDWNKCDQCGKCAEVCLAGGREMVGRNITVAQLMSEIERDVPFYDQSGGGVTFTGGEPMLQTEFLKETLLACKKQLIHTVVDTSGHTAWGNLISVAPLVDLFLYDVKLMDETRHILYTQVSNKLILNNLVALAEAGAHILVRIPLIPGVNDDDENIEQCAAYLENIRGLIGAEVMPYHEIGIAKYQALGMKYKLETIHPPTDQEVESVEQRLSKRGVAVIKHQGRAA
jgi:pyruvate formate lyase activating enzyme